TNRPIHSDGGNPTRLGLGFPIRTPTGQSSVDSSPRPIAASHVLHRRLVPRHPPYATITWPPQIQDARAHYPRIKTPATNPPTTQSTERNPQTVFDRGGIRENTHPHPPAKPAGARVAPSDTQQRAPRLFQKPRGKFNDLHGHPGEMSTDKQHHHRVHFRVRRPIQEKGRLSKTP